jgi:hypothetical protein
MTSVLPEIDRSSPDMARGRPESRARPLLSRTGRAISSAILARVRRQHDRVTPGPAARTLILDGRLGIEFGRLGLRRIGFGQCEHYSLHGRDLRLGIGFGQREHYSLHGRDLRLGIGFGRRDHIGRRGVPLGVLNAGNRRWPKPNMPLRGGPPRRLVLRNVGFGRREWRSVKRKFQIAKELSREAQRYFEAEFYIKIF